jgi:hypothetical protein
MEDLPIDGMDEAPPSLDETLDQALVEMGLTRTEWQSALKVLHAFKKKENLAKIGDRHFKEFRVVGME